VVRGDIRDRRTVEDSLEGTDAVVHFAAETHVDHSIGDASSFVLTNVYGTYHLIDVACKRGIRFHHVSTDEVFGHLPHRGSFNETTPYAPRNPYSATKAGADHLVRSFVNTHGLQATISNCSNNYGPRQAMDKLVPKAIAYAVEGRPFPLYAGGHQVRDWLHVDDHASAIACILEKGTPGETYLVGGDCELANRDLVRRIYELVGTEFQAETVTDRPGHDLRYSIDHSKLTRELDWKPTIPLDDGLRRTVDWYVERLRASSAASSAGRGSRP
jgi:dTDP-glucose 4,6-dehydratase